MKKAAILLLGILCMSLCLAHPEVAGGEGYYTVTFDANGGKFSDDRKTIKIQVEAGKCIPVESIPTNLIYDGYTFDNYWYEFVYYTATRTEHFNLENTPINSNLYLYAGYRMNSKYWISFDANGGTGRYKSIELGDNPNTYQRHYLPDGDKYFKRDGYTFDGWMKNDRNSDTTHNIYMFDKEDEDVYNIIFYAKWKRIYVDINFDFNGGICTSDGNYNKYPYTTIPKGDTIASYEPDFSMPKSMYKEHYTFAGWHKKDANGKPEKTPFDYNTPITETLNLIAVYTPATYAVHFVANGGMGTMADQAFTYDVSQKLNGNAFTNSCYAFDGWTTNADGTGNHYADGQSIKVEKETTLYARWKALPIQIKQQPQDAKVEEGQKTGFATEAEGEELSYQWYVDKGDGQGFTPCDGETAPSLNLSKTELAQDGYQYYCLISNRTGNLRTRTATLGIKAPARPPRTGDDSRRELWLGLCAISGIGIAALVLQGRKRKA